MENTQKSTVPTPTFGSLSSLSKDGGNPFGSGPKLFGSSTPSPSQFGTSTVTASAAAPAQSQTNVFSQGSATVFGSASTPPSFQTVGGMSGGKLFGSGTGTGQHGSFSQPVPPSSNLFSSTSTPAVTMASNMFGSGSSSGSIMSAAPPQSAQLFGARSTGNPFSSAATGGASTRTTPAPNVFGSTSSPSSFTSSTAQFGSLKTLTSPSSSSSSSTSPVSGPTLFGKKLPSSSSAGASSFPSSSEPVFGSFSQKGVTTSASNSGFDLFKGNAGQTSSSTGFSPNAPTGSLFGSGQRTSPAPSSSSPSSYSNRNQPGVLFGKPQPPTVPSSLSSSSSSSFGTLKDKSSSILFGKPVTAGATTGQSQKSATSELFVGSSKTMSLEGDKSTGTGSGKASGLFGKPAALFSGGRPRSVDDAEGTKAEDEDYGEDAEDTSSPKKSLGRWKTNRKPATAMPMIRRRSLLASTRSASDVLSEDTAPSNVLMVCNIPPDLCEKETLREHFAQYGNIKLLRVNPDKCTASITFDTKESALKAKEATVIDDERPPLDIFYRQTPQNLAAKRTISKNLKPDPRKKFVSQDAEDELRSMAEIIEFETGPMSAPKASSTKPPFRSGGMSRHHSPTPPPPRRSSPTPQLHTTAISVPQDTPDIHAAPDVSTIKGLLKSLYQAKATETNERIAVLDKRDQLLKLLRGRQQSDLASAKAFKGTCPDMCPEKERYYREDTRRLALYEVILSTMSNVAGQKTKVDHSKAVKEYSRSSADQVEPLSHELRPLSVLQSTMAYLLKQVADEGGEEKWSEWYDYLWNRTRGIRKDITQQQLCHTDVAHLLEQCARFHIFCSERLCEEDMMTFDPKINDENLTKCLQTLKELYSDLESKHGCLCPDEAEIRAYIVLMNLNQGDTLREIQQLRPEIRDSPSIRFAVRAYNALNSSNYVRFFRLIKETTFLNGCILHRYFNQIRSKALRIIKKALTTQGKSVSYPVNEMIRLMCFENASEVVEFCSHYGLRVDSGAVLLDSTALYEPEGSVPQWRSIALVESKRAVSVGETIYGGPLPELDLPRPFSSFDADGHFVFSTDFQQALASGGLKIPSQVGEILSRGPAGSAGVASLPVAGAGGVSVSAGSDVSDVDGGAVMLGTPPTVLPEGQRLPLARDVARSPYSNDAIKSAARALILEETDRQALGIVHEVVEMELVRQAVMETVCDEIVESAMTESVRAVAGTVLDEEEQALRHALEEASRKQQCMDGVRDEVVGEVVASLVHEVVGEEWRLIERERDRRAWEQRAVSCADSLLDAVVRESVDDVAWQVFQVDVLDKRERLARTEAAIRHGKMRQAFQRWHRLYLRSVRVKRAMLDFPVAPPSRSHTHQLSALVPSRPSSHITDKSFYVGERAKLTVCSPMSSVYDDLHLAARLSMASAQHMLSGLRMWQPLDVPGTVSHQLHNLLDEWKSCNVVAPDTQYVQWKLVLSTPAQKSVDEMDFIRWIRTKLGWQPKDDGSDDTPVTTTEGDIINKFTTTLMIANRKPLSLSFCARGFHGNWKDTQATNAARLEVLKGMNGLVFVTSDAATLLDEEQESKWKKDRLRLLDMLTRKSKRPAVPLVLIVPRLTAQVTVTSSLLEDRLQLSILHRRGLLSAVHFAQPCVHPRVVGEDFGVDWISQLSNCLRFLSGRIPPPPCLATKPLADFVEDGVVEYYKTSVYQDLRTRTRHQLLHQSPNTLLSLYNDVIDHLAMVVASHTLSQASWPAPEFDQQSVGVKSHWNSQDHLCGVYELMSMLRLPVFRYGDMEADGWDGACRDVWKYVEAVTKRDSGSAKICLYQKVVELLHTSRKRFDQFCWLASEHGACEPTYVNMAWTDLVEACVCYKMVSLRTGHLHITEDERDKKDEEEGPEEEEEFEETIVYYDQSELEDYETPSGWLEALRDTETVASLHIKETMVKKGGVKRTLDQTDLQEEALKKRNRLEEESENEIEASVHQTTEKADPALQSLSESYFEMLDSEKQASERYEKILSSVLDSSDLNQTANVSTPYYRHRHGVEDSNPSPSTPTTAVEARPNLKRRKLSDILSGSLVDSWQADVTTRPRHKMADVPPRSPSSEFEGDHEEADGVLDLDASMTNRVLSLKEEVDRQKQLDTIYEMKLRRWMAEFDSPV